MYVNLFIPTRWRPEKLQLSEEPAVQSAPFFQNDGMKDEHHLLIGRTKEANLTTKMSIIPTMRGDLAKVKLI